MPEIEVRIGEPNFSFATDALNVYVIMKITDTRRKVMNMDSAGFVVWNEIDYPAGEEVKPSITLQNDIAILLRDALNNRFQGTADANTLRRDLEHERKRRDSAEENVMRLALVIGDIADKLADQ